MIQPGYTIYIQTTRKKLKYDKKKSCNLYINIKMIQPDYTIYTNHKKK
jgi:hypothetical protein